MDELSLHLDELVVDGPDALDRAVAAALRGSAPGRLDSRLASEIGGAVARSLIPMLPGDGGHHENSGHRIA